MYPDYQGYEDEVPQYSPNSRPMQGRVPPQQQMPSP